MMEQASPIDILQKYWGYPGFRPPQEAIISSVLKGQDTLALLPTGGGKSICFQVPALCQPGLCVVVSPLIALMKDQVFQLQERGISAVAIHSGMRYKDIDRLLDNCVYGGVKLLYLSPERLTTELLQERIQRMSVSLLAVDEAHCISQWGYDFRPAYLKIAEIRALLPETPVLALTATATPEVVTDIQQKLEFKEERVFRKSFVRSNLSYSVFEEEAKPKRLLEVLRNVPGSSVVYVRNRRKTREIATFLQQMGISASYYHAGLDQERRSERQEQWIAGKIRVMVSTNAFGMGIDKSNVRTVVHLDLPESLEAYFQEAGRAGRDGKKAYAVLLYEQADLIRLRHTFEQSFPSFAEIKRVYQALGSYFQLAVGSQPQQSFDFDLVQFAKTYRLEVNKTLHALKVLEQAGWLVLTESVYIPSTFEIKVSREVLYDYQIRNKKLEPLIKSLLRTHHGAFQNRIHVKESALGRFLNQSPQVIRKSLELLRQDNIIDYQAAKDAPQLFWIQPRVDAEALTIDQERYHFRKQRYQYRIEQVEAYLQTPKCRTIQMTHYFGEKLEEPCGICDVCLGRIEAPESQAWQPFKPLLLEKLKREGPLKADELLQAYTGKKRELALQALNELLEEEQVLEKKGRIQLAR